MVTNSFENTPGFFFSRGWVERDFLFFPLFPMCAHDVPKGNPSGSGDIVLGLGFGLPGLKSMARKVSCFVANAIPQILHKESLFGVTGWVVWWL